MQGSGAGLGVQPHAAQRLRRGWLRRLVPDRPRYGGLARGPRGDRPAEPGGPHGGGHRPRPPGSTCRPPRSTISPSPCPTVPPLHAWADSPHRRVSSTTASSTSSADRPCSSSTPTATRSNWSPRPLADLSCRRRLARGRRRAAVKAIWMVRPSWSTEERWVPTSSTSDDEGIEREADDVGGAAVDEGHEQRRGPLHAVAAAALSRGSPVATYKSIQASGSSSAKVTAVVTTVLAHHHRVGRSGRGCGERPSRCARGGCSPTGGSGARAGAGIVDRLPEEVHVEVDGGVGGDDELPGRRPRRRPGGRLGALRRPSRSHP